MKLSAETVAKVQQYHRALAAFEDVKAGAMRAFEEWSKNRTPALRERAHALLSKAIDARRAAQNEYQSARDSMVRDVLGETPDGLWYGFIDYAAKVTTAWNDASRSVASEDK